MLKWQKQTNNLFYEEKNNFYELRKKNQVIPAPEEVNSVFKFAEVTNFDHFTSKMNESGLNIVLNIKLEGGKWHNIYVFYS